MSPSFGLMPVRTAAGASVHGVRTPPSALPCAPPTSDGGGPGRTRRGGACGGGVPSRIRQRARWRTAALAT